MKYLFLLLFATTAWALEPKGVLYDVEILRVIDGDTVVITASWVPAPMKKEISVRVSGIDTPEKDFRAHCDSEAQRGEESTVFTKTAVASSKTHQVIFRDWDKYGGRILGDVLLDGRSLRSMLIENNLADPYDGGKKRDWCQVK